jgi:hypothetical protein
MMNIDVVGCLLSVAEKWLQTEQIRYTIEKTVPTRDFFKVDDDRLYVVRQKLMPTGELQLVVAAKMRKEV